MRLFRLVGLICGSVSALCAAAGCSDGPAKRKPLAEPTEPTNRLEANYSRIKSDGSESLVAVEKIMGEKGTEVALKKGDAFFDMAERLKGKKVLSKVGDNFITIPSDNGDEVKWIRWGDEKKYVIVAVLQDKVFWKGTKGIAP